VTGPLRACKVIAVPYRREPRGGRTQYADYTLAQVLTELRVSELRSRFPRARSGNVYTSGLHAAGLVTTEFSDYASEGGISPAPLPLPLIKVQPDGMEWSILDLWPSAEARRCVGRLRHIRGDPEHGVLLAPGCFPPFGVTRLTRSKAGLKQGILRLRARWTRRPRCPKDLIRPSLNELYDNKLWALGESPRMTGRRTPRTLPRSPPA
jgi:hypothetical protein